MSATPSTSPIAALVEGNLSTTVVRVPFGVTFEMRAVHPPV
jgi:hypothetical protein